MKRIHNFSSVIIILFISFFLTACDEPSEKEMLYAYEYLILGYAPYTWGVIVYSDGSVKSYETEEQLQDLNRLSKIEIKNKLLEQTEQTEFEYLFSLSEDELTVFKDTINVEDFDGVNFLSSDCNYNDITFYPYYLDFVNGKYTPKMIIKEAINVEPESKRANVLQGYEIIVNKLLEKGYISQYRADCTLRKL